MERVELKVPWKKSALKEPRFRKSRILGLRELGIELVSQVVRASRAVHTDAMKGGLTLVLFF